MGFTTVFLTNLHANRVINEDIINETVKIAKLNSLSRVYINKVAPSWTIDWEDPIFWPITIIKLRSLIETDYLISRALFSPRKLLAINLN
jgi:hypothetical protein